MTRGPGRSEDSGFVAQVPNGSSRDETALGARQLAGSGAAALLSARAWQSPQSPGLL